MIDTLYKFPLLSFTCRIEHTEEILSLALSFVQLNFVQLFFRLLLNTTCQLPLEMTHTVVRYLYRYCPWRLLWGAHKFDIVWGITRVHWNGDDVETDEILLLSSLFRFVCEEIVGLTDIYQPYLLVRTLPWRTPCARISLFR